MPDRPWAPEVYELRELVHCGLSASLIVGFRPNNEPFPLLLSQFGGSSDDRWKRAQGLVDQIEIACEEVDDELVRDTLLNLFGMPPYERGQPFDARRRNAAEARTERPDGTAARTHAETYWRKKAYKDLSMLFDGMRNLAPQAPRALLALAHELELSDNLTESAQFNSVVDLASRRKVRTHWSRQVRLARSGATVLLLHSNEEDSIRITPASRSLAGIEPAMRRNRHGGEVHFLHLREETVKGALREVAYTKHFGNAEESHDYTSYAVRQETHPGPLEASVEFIGSGTLPPYLFAFVQPAGTLPALRFGRYVQMPTRRRCVWPFRTVEPHMSHGLLWAFKRDKIVDDVLSSGRVIQASQAR